MNDIEREEASENVHGIVRHVAMIEIDFNVLLITGDHDSISIVTCINVSLNGVYLLI